jgi:FkbM family methyltransferase
MADKEQNDAVPAENQPESIPAEASAAADMSGDPGDDENNFGEDTTAAGFEDNFGLGEQQLSAGRIPSVPSSTLKKKAPVPPVAPLSAPSAQDFGDSGPVLSAQPQDAGNFDDSVLSGDSAASQSETPEKGKSPEEELFDQFQLMRVPLPFCKYAEWFRKYLYEHPDALKNLEAMLCDEASVETVRLGMKRLRAFPSPEFQDIVFYLPYGMATESELADWDKHVERFPEYVKLTNGEYPYFDPPQFFYHHGAVFLDDAVKARLADGVFYQCGAYCGASLIAMGQYKPLRMYGFEPAQACETFLKGNIKRSGLKNVVLYKLCVGDRVGNAVVADRDKDGKPCKTKSTIVSLDYFKQGKGETGRTAWIQADVGGMSLPVIRGAEQMIKQEKPLLTVAIYHNPEEFFEIVPLLHEWVPEYKFMVRRCQCNLRIPYSEITLIAYVP